MRITHETTVKDQHEVEKIPKVFEVFQKCDTTGKKGKLDYDEVLNCFKKFGVKKDKYEDVGNVILRYAYLPKSNWKAIAAGIAKATNGKVKTGDAFKGLKSCDANKNKRIGYKEAKNCLKKYSKELDLKNPAAFEKAKWLLAKGAEISKNGAKRALSSMTEPSKVSFCLPVADFGNVTMNVSASVYNSFKPPNFLLTSPTLSLPESLMANGCAHISKTQHGQQPPFVIVNSLSPASLKISSSGTQM